MLKLPHNKVAVIPIFDAEETRGGIIKPTSFSYMRDVQRFDIYGTRNWDREPQKINECESLERARYVIQQYENKGYIKVSYKIVKVQENVEMLDSGDRCDQGIVKYVGKGVKDVMIGDYVFFSGYTGTRAQIEGEGDLIILPEDFIEFKLDDDYPQTIIPGLYYKDKDGEYFEATYESAMNIIAETFTLTGKTLHVVPSPPKLEDYNVR